MLAALAVGLSLAAKTHANACATVARLAAPALELRLDQAALSPPSLRRAERACLAAVAGQRVGQTPDTLEPGVDPALALGRSDLFETLAGRLRDQCAQDDAPKACAPGKTAKVAPWPRMIDQSQQGFALWLKVERGRAAQARRLEAFLRKQKLAGIAPTYQLLRTASDWRTCGGEPFAVPPPEDWQRAARTLGWIRRRVKPAIGAVEFVSGYREPALNACADGAKASAHLGFWALDLEPLDPAIDRAGLMQTLCAVHKQYGQAAAIGLGFYAGLRFHIDSERYRHWGFDPVAAPACAVEAPPGVDAASPLHPSGPPPPQAGEVASPEL